MLPRDILFQVTIPSKQQDSHAKKQCDVEVDENSHKFPFIDDTVQCGRYVLFFDSKEENKRASRLLQQSESSGRPECGQYAPLSLKLSERRGDDPGDFALPHP